MVDVLWTVLEPLALFKEAPSCFLKTTLVGTEELATAPLLRADLTSAVVTGVDVAVIGGVVNDLVQLHCDQNQPTRARTKIIRIRNAIKRKCLDPTSVGSILIS